LPGKNGGDKHKTILYPMPDTQQLRKLNKKDFHTNIVLFTQNNCHRPACLQGQLAGRQVRD
jgi:hypothetical protein